MREKKHGKGESGEKIIDEGKGSINKSVLNPLGHRHSKKQYFSR